MATKQHTIMTIKNALVSIDGDEYADAITEVTVNVSYDSTEFVPVSGNVQTSVGELKHVINLNFGQSFVEGELTHTLYTRHGEADVPFSIRPQGGTTPSVSGLLTITAPTSLAGAVGAASTTAVLPVKGKPTTVWAAPATP